MTENIWTDALAKLDIADAVMIAESRYDPARRAYALGDRVYKIVLTDYDSTGHKRQQTYSTEYAILKKCIGISGIPHAVDYVHKGGLDVLVLSKIDNSVNFKFDVTLVGFLSLLRKLSGILVSLSLRGISHNDIRASNLLIDAQRRVFLVDYDQATYTGVCVALLRNFFGVEMGGSPNHGSLAGVVKNQVIRILPRKALMILKRILGHAKDEQIWQILTASASPLPRIPDNASPQLRSIGRAWLIAQNSKASSPNLSISYYALDFEGFRFPGERPWSERWNVLKDIADVRSKRVLELGCNLALLTCHLLREGGAIAGMSVDREPDILQGAKAVADAYGVKPKFRQVNFDDLSDWETELIEFKPDIVFALSVLNWVNDKKRLMIFLSNFREVVFEGHDDAETEMQRFRDVGFDHIEHIGSSERQRPILHCKKSCNRM